VFDVLLSRVVCTDLAVNEICFFIVAALESAVTIFQGQISQVETENCGSCIIKPLGSLGPSGPSIPPRPLKPVDQAGSLPPNSPPKASRSFIFLILNLVSY
jgi:hypothetical protein